VTPLLMPSPAPLPAPMLLPPVIPVLHSVMMGVVQLVNARGALLLLGDGSSTCYLNGFLRHRPGMPRLPLGTKLFVKIVRLEPGLVFVDQRAVDQKTGRDTDPENASAEVETVVDVPAHLVGYIIGKGGSRIRQICEDTGADLRFDPATGMAGLPGVEEPAAAAPAARCSRGGAAPGAATAAAAARAGGPAEGAGADLRRFLEAARAEDADGGGVDRAPPAAAPAAAPPSPASGAAEDPAGAVAAAWSSRRPASGGSPGPDGAGAGDGDDLRRFLEDAAGCGADALGSLLEEARGGAEGGGSREAQVVEFVANDLRNWEDLLLKHMDRAGVTEIHLDNLSVKNSHGEDIDIANGLRHEHFPIRVTYTVPPPDEDAGDDAGAGTAEGGRAAREREESDDHPPNDIDAQKLDYPALIRSSYRRANPEKLPDVPNLLARFPGRENELYLRICEKYGLEPHPAARAAAKEVDGAARAAPKRVNAPSAHEEFSGATAAVEEEETKRKIFVSGCKNLTKTHLAEVFAVKDLPVLAEIEHLTKTDVLCVFATPEAASAALMGVKLGDFPKFEPGMGPGLYRAIEGLLEFRMATKADVKAQKEIPTHEHVPAGHMPMVRMRMNGDAVDVRNAENVVRELVRELLGRRVPGSLTAPGDSSQRVPVPSELVGRVIGKQGETIAKLERESGARLRILKAEEGDEDEEFQDLLIRGSSEAVAKAVELVEPLVKAPWSRAAMRGQRSNNASRRRSPPPARRRRSSRSPSASSRLADLRRSPRRAPAQDMSPKVEETRWTSNVADSVPQGMPLAARLKDKNIDLYSAVTGQTHPERKERRQNKGIELQEYKLRLKKQWQLNRAAVSAEATAAEAANYARTLLSLPEDMAGTDTESDDDAENWAEEPGSVLLGRPALTSFGAGRVSRSVVTQRGQRYLTVRLLAGGSVQAPEQSALHWLAAVERWLGERVVAPAGKTTAPQQPPHLSESKGNANSIGLVVDQAVDTRREIAFRLVLGTGAMVQPLARYITASELVQWSCEEVRIYLVELCTTPAAMGHIAPYRHDYRSAREPYAKGELVVIEGAKPGTHDVGTVRKVLLGAKAKKLEATASASAAVGALPCTRRVLRRCSVAERTLREGAMASLESSALPLFSAMLPPGAEAVGVGANLDGTRLRLFVRMSADGVGGKASPQLAMAAVAAAAGLGAQLGCETELLSECVAPKPSKQAGKTEPSTTLGLDQPEEQQQSQVPDRQQASTQRDNADLQVAVACKSAKKQKQQKNEKKKKSIKVDSKVKKVEKRKVMNVNRKSHRGKSSSQSGSDSSSSSN